MATINAIVMIKNINEKKEEILAPTKERIATEDSGVANNLLKRTIPIITKAVSKIWVSADIVHRVTDELSLVKRIQHGF
jgi:hypothetical protein